MKKSIELMPGELQAVPMSEAHIARAVSLAEPTNQKVREAADARMRFEDEPQDYKAFLHAQP